MKRWEDEEFEPLPTTMPASFGSRRPLIEEEEEDDDDNLVDDMDALSLSDECTSEEEAFELPEHACRYCSLSDPECVAKCNGCNRWFCNHLSQSSGSHIIQHLVKARHKEISLHPESPLVTPSLSATTVAVATSFCLATSQPRLIQWWCCFVVILVQRLQGRTVVGTWMLGNR